MVTEWQANDPLVHYTVGDLSNLHRPTSCCDTDNSYPSARLARPC